MKNYRVNVNNKEYLVKVEEISEAEAAKAESANPAPAPQASPAPAANKASAGSEILKSPIQGSIFKILKKAGESVEAGEPIIILEAMKLENEIVAPRDLVVSEVLVSEGQVVDADDPLVSFE